MRLWIQNKNRELIALNKDKKNGIVSSVLLRL